MPLVKCSGCGRKQVVAAAFAGLKVTCEGCGVAFTAREYRRPDAHAPNPWQVSAGDTGRAILLVAGLAASVALAAFVVVALATHKDRPPVAADREPASRPQRQADGRDRSRPRDADARPVARPEPADGAAEAADKTADGVNRVLIGLVGLAVALAWMVVLFGTATWMVRDCRNRSADSGLFWGILLVFFGLATCVGGPFVLVMYLASRPNGMLVAFRRVCDSVGVDFGSQLKKLKTRSWSCVVQITMQIEDGQRREFTMIDLDTLHGWLVSLNENKLALDQRFNLVRYQKEAVAALRKHFHGDPAPAGDPLTAQIEAILAMRKR